jgi:cyclase
LTTVTYKTGVIEIAPQVYAFIQESGATNSGFIVGEEGVLVIDSLMTPSLATRLLSAIRSVTKAPIRYLVDTHYHGDHVFGNQYFVPAPIIGHINCRRELIEKFDANMQRYRNTRPELIPELEQIRMTLPDLTFEDRMNIRLGDREIQLIYLGRAHTAGDILLHLPQDGILYAGDIAFHKVLPAFPDGHITKWLEVMEQTARIDVQTIVPGHGPVGGKAEFEEAKELMAHLHSEVRRGFDQGLTEEETARNVNLGKFGNFLGQDRVGLVTHMAYLAYRGELE